MSDNLIVLLIGLYGLIAILGIAAMIAHWFQANEREAEQEKQKEYEAMRKKTIGRKEY